MQIIEESKQYDAIIVGSGAGGGMSAKVLADAGLNIAIVEAGPYFDPKDPETQTQFKWSYDSPRRGAGTTRHFGDFDMAYGGYDIEGEPYTTTEDTEFRWFRSRMLGGRTNHWGRISLRFGPQDFKARDKDGLGDNWPISYEDVKPYYDKIDKLIGVFGSKERLPNDPDGFFLPPPKPRLHELYYIKGAEKVGIKAIPSRLSILTKRLNEERGVCYFCRQCSRSCSIYADFSAGSCLVFPAQKSKGQVDLYVNAMVRQVSTGKDGKATGVHFINKEDRKEYHLRGKVVVLAASACGSARILLNSKSPQHPNGLGNSSGVVGKYLHDSTGSSSVAIIPELLDRKMTYNEDGIGGLHVYSPWWGDNKKLDFPRGYHIELGGGMSMPSYGFGSNLQRMAKHLGHEAGGYGDQLRKDVKRLYGATLGLAGRGECIAREDNYCELDPDTVDEFGIPVLRFNYTFSEHELNQAKHMHKTFAEVFDALGAEPMWEAPGKEQNYGLDKPGEVIHEVGTTRMGDNPKTSVTNKYQQLHDADNVFVVDAGPFVSQADKNCTWTILALSWRASDYIVEQIKKRNI